MRRQSHSLFRDLLVSLSLLMLTLPQPAAALLAAHQNVDGCDTCHLFHGSPSQSGGLLSELSAEATCLSCHGPLGPATRKATTHGMAGQITCLECHNPHNNDHLNATGGYNIMLVGMEYDANRFATGVTSYLPKPQIREETPTATPGETSLNTLRDVVFEVSPDDWHRPADGYGVCNICHGTGLHNEGADCAGCHAHDGGFAGAGCTGCHSAKATGDAGVGIDSPHVTVGRATGYNTFVDCTDCHSGHADGVIGPNDFEIATTLPTFNAKYTSHVATGAIQLGGAKTSGSSEAEICWNCHQNDTYQGTVDISEWDGSSAVDKYDYGSVTADNLNWLTTTWSSAKFAYKDGKLTNKPTVADPIIGTLNGGSTHGVMGGAMGVDSVTKIGCSACHDVHDTGGGANDEAGPFLRGSWLSNPYKEDGAPQAGDTWTTGTSVYFKGTTTTTTVPRSSTTENGPGGYQIDQNNGNPNAAYAYTTNDNLCSLCHTQTAIQDAWAGHINAVKGFTNDLARNIFSNAVTGRSTLNNRFNPGMAYQGVTNYYNSKGWMGGFRETASGANQGLTQPKVDGQAYGYKTANFQWGVQGSGLTNIDITGSSVNADYHNFSCSKCHSPHASRLPRLLITNCLDVKLNKWDENSTLFNDPRWSNWPNLTPVSGQPGNKQLAYAKTAQNCHRYVDQNGNRTYDAATPFESAGWNKATPW